MKKNTLLIAGLSFLAVVLTTTWLVSSPTPPTSEPVTAQRPDPTMALPSSIQLPEVSANTPLPPLPPELEGLEPEVELVTDAEGHLVPTQELRVLLDFYLANIDQEPLAIVLARIKAAISQRLAEPALSQAFSLLERYVGYRMTLEQLQNDLPDGMTATGFDRDALRQRLDRLKQLQHDLFGRDEIDAFFSEDTRLDEYTLASLDIRQNSSLSEFEKQRQLEALEQTLPTEVRQARARAVIHGEVYEQAEALKAADASAAELYQLRAQSLGEDAAVKLAELDQQQQAWQQRLTDYRQQKSQILEAGLSEADQNAAVADLQSRLFDDREQLRVRALDSDLL